MNPYAMLSAGIGTAEAVELSTRQQLDVSWMIAVVVTVAIIASLGTWEIATWLSWRRRRQAERQRAMRLLEQIWNARSRAEFRERRSTGHAATLADGQTSLQGDRNHQNGYGCGR